MSFELILVEITPDVEGQWYAISQRVEDQPPRATHPEDVWTVRGPFTGPRDAMAVDVPELGRTPVTFEVRPHDPRDPLEAAPYLPLVNRCRADAGLPALPAVADEDLLPDGWNPDDEVPDDLGPVGRVLRRLTYGSDR